MNAEELSALRRPPVNGGSSSVSPAPQTPRIIRHLAPALLRHVRQLRQDGLPVPAEVDAWAAFLTHSARIRPEQTVVDDDLRCPQPASVVPRLLVTKAGGCGGPGPDPSALVPAMHGLHQPQLLPLGAYAKGTPLRAHCCVLPGWHKPDQHGPLCLPR
jgi:hypothetical protein